MTGLFSTPSLPPPPPPPPPAPSPTDAAAQDAARQTAVAAATASGRASTILTSGMGDLSPAPAGKKTLLGA